MNQNENHHLAVVGYRPTTISPSLYNQAASAPIYFGNVNQQTHLPYCQQMRPVENVTPLEAEPTMKPKPSAFVSLITNLGCWALGAFGLWLAICVPVRLIISAPDKPMAPELMLLWGALGAGCFFAGLWMLIAAIILSVD